MIFDWLKHTSFPIFFLATALGSGCATTYKITPYPSDAKITVKNPLTQELFELGQGKMEFRPKTEYGDAFILSASKEGFNSRDIFISKNPGTSSEYLITLKKDGLAGGDTSKKDEEEEDDPSRDPASVTESGEDYKALIDKRVKELLDPMLKEIEDNRLKTEEERRQLLAEKLRLEMDKKAMEAEKKVAVLERSFDVYKDALFSERYARGPATYDRNRIDTSVEYVNRIQTYIDDKKYELALQLVDKLLEHDEYFAKGYALKGTIKYLQSNFKAAKAAWERAIEIDPNDRVSRHYLTEVLPKGNSAPVAQRPVAANTAPSTAPAAGSTNSEPPPIGVNVREQ